MPYHKDHQASAEKKRRESERGMTPYFVKSRCLTILTKITKRFGYENVDAVKIQRLQN